MIDQPPEALVRGCNDPVSIGVLSDWVEEQYGIALDLDRSGWSENIYFGGCCYGGGHGYGSYNYNGYGNGDGSGYGCGLNIGDGFGSGYGCSDGFGNGIAYGNRINADGFGFGYGHGYFQFKVNL